MGRNGSGITSGYNNVVIEKGAGTIITTGNNNVCIGFNSTCSAGNASNEINLGNVLVLLQQLEQTASIVSLSDERDKKDVIDLPWGLEFVDKLRPVQFTWDRRVLTPEDVNHGSNGKKATGFLAISNV